ncbi:MAG: ribonuclease PH [Propionibacteriaceae bacterium]|nr:ribonuclease PH [Propionibacteriaceae bacterium]
MKRTAALAKLRKAARAQGFDFDITELTCHSAVRVGGTTRTLGRHSEIDDLTAHKFFDRFADELGGKGSWR